MVRPAEGALYSGSSITWRFNSRSFVLLGGPRAAILQICDPGVAAGVAAYSTYRTDPLGRLERTLEAMLAISFGGPDRREAVLAGLEKAHERVNGTLADGTAYSALDADRQYWVLATLIDTVIEVDRRYLGKMCASDRVAYYEESKRLAAAFAIPESLVPYNYDAFRDYFTERVSSLEPTDDSREVTRELMAPRIPFVPGFAWLPFNLITTELLPARMRHHLGLRDLNVAELTAVRATQVSMRNSVAHVSGILTANPFNARALRSVA